MARAKTLPHLWLISDARNDAGLERALAALPRGSGLIYRHYHLAGPERFARFRELQRIATYGAPRSLSPRRRGLIHLATAHDLREIGLARRLGADAALLSPVFPTRSHPGGAVLGSVRFRLLARQARLPVIALGGMTGAKARALGWRSWAAIDGLS